MPAHAKTASGHAGRPDRPLVASDRVRAACRGPQTKGARDDAQSRQSGGPGGHRDCLGGRRRSRSARRTRRAAAREHGPAVGQDRRGHGGRLRRVPERRPDLHGLRVEGDVPRDQSRASGAASPRTPPSSRPPTGCCRTTSRRRRRRSTRCTPRRSRRFRTVRRSSSGCSYGAVAADKVIVDATGDGLMTPIGVDVVVPDAHARPGRVAADAARVPAAADAVGRERAPVHPQERGSVPAAAAAVAVEPEMGRGVQRDQGATARARPERRPRRAIAKFWTANVIRQYNGLARDVATRERSGSSQTARLVAMVNVVGADAQIAVHEREVPLPVLAAGDGDRPDVGDRATASARRPGFDDGNPATAEQPGWRPLIATPNHPEYPAAHGSITSAEAEVFSRLPRHRHDQRRHPRLRPGRARRNLNAVRHFAPPRTCGRRSSTPASGPACTTASRARPASPSAHRSPTTTWPAPSLARATSSNAFCFWGARRGHPRSAAGP